MIRRDGQLKYKQIHEELERFIAKAKPGEKLPPERELAKDFGCNVLTVRKALAPLVARGQVVRRTGSGSFVAALHDDDGNGAARDVNTIGMLIHSRADAYAMSMVKAISEAAAQQAVKLRVASADGFGEPAMQAARLLAQEGCSALIIPWAPYREISELAIFAGKCPLPFTLPALIPGFERNCFETPEVTGLGTIMGTRAVCEYLRLLGGRRIALLGPDTKGDFAMSEKLVAYSEFVFKNDLDNLAALVGPTAEAMDALATKWAAHQGNLSILCYDDVHATRFMTAMHKLGLSAPGDFRIVGCNDTREAAFADPPLTSLRGDYAHLGDITVRCARAAARGQEWHSTTPAPNTLVIRESCGGATRLDSKLKEALKAFVITRETAPPISPNRPQMLHTPKENQQL
ncbi:MAG: substrate-binding domain-containing protein [Lentisphaeria bacterium]